MRTACVTIHSWREWCRQLLIVAEETLPGAFWAKGFLSPHLSPHFWDSPPFACNLRDAYHGFPAIPRVHRGAAEALKEVCNGPPPDDPNQFPKAQKHFQSLAYSKLLTTAFPQHTLHSTNLHCVQYLFAPYSLEGEDVDI